MKKFFLLFLIFVFLPLVYFFGFSKDSTNVPIERNRSTILTVGMVADSHTENDFLEKALSDLKSRNVDFVIGLGDYTNLGTAEELNSAKSVFEKSGLSYFVIPGDRDGWESREKGLGNSAQFLQTFGVSGMQTFEKKGVRFVLVDNSDLYKGIGAPDWADISTSLSKQSNLTLVFAHKTPYHPDSVHIMGEDSAEVAGQAIEFMNLMERSKVDGFFSGDLHFFGRFNSPDGSVRISTIGAVASLRNFQGPRFSILRVYDDFSWEVSDIPIT